MIDKKNLKYVYLFFIFLILIILIIFIIIHNSSNKNENQPNEIEDTLENSEFTYIDSTVKKVNIRNNYYIVDKSVRKFYAFVNNDSEENDVVSTDEAVYNLLDSEYIQYKNITEDNVLSVIGKEKYTDIVINDMYVSQRNFDISIYFVYGNLKYGTELKPFSMIVKVDRTNDTFKVYLDDYVKEKYSDIKPGDTINIEVEESVSNDIYNVFNYNNISDDTYARDLFSQLKFYIMSDNQHLYNILSEEYKKQFNSYQEFYDYISSIYINLITMSYGSFEKSKNDDGKFVYTLYDSKDKYIIYIYEENTFDYKVAIEDFV